MLVFGVCLLRLLDFLMPRSSFFRLLFSRSFLAAVLLLSGGALSAGPVAQVKAMQDASLVVGDKARLLIADQPDRLLIPASTMKLVTALAAIERWGLGHRFETEFYQDASGRLWVLGGGDPYLVSEEIDRIIAGLRGNGMNSVAGIGVDASLFGPTVKIPGRSSSNNPYDAPVTALAVNFNTVSLLVSGTRVTSAEPQTPLTATGERLGRRLGAGKHRVNLGNEASALEHFGEVLRAKMQQGGIRVEGPVQMGGTPSSARLLYTHRNSRTLETVIANMLEYSTNFVANDLFLLLGERDGRGSMAQSQQALERWARKRFGWRNARIEDGAGLSRGNRLSGRQLIDVLEALAPYRHLLPQQDDDPAVRAKTGTLRGISAYAGFVRRSGSWVPFSLLINQPVAYGLRLQVASELARSATLARRP
jgi:D-alanyl-D-alanine carboxypeptidase/D-alanyl-D-alanine-endopeptidase (penicillin-binding protein 4)